MPFHSLSAERDTHKGSGERLRWANTLPTGPRLRIVLPAEQMRPLISVPTAGPRCWQWGPPGCVCLCFNCLAQPMTAGGESRSRCSAPEFKRGSTEGSMQMPAISLHVKMAVRSTPRRCLLSWGVGGGKQLFLPGLHIFFFQKTKRQQKQGLGSVCKDWKPGGE